MWLQRSKEKELLEGDALTSNFISKASSRKRKNRITSIKTTANDVIQGDKDLLLFATSFYKNLFGPAVGLTNISLDINLPVVLSDVDRKNLDRKFTLEEIKIAVFDMKPNKAPGPDGFPIEFYQKYWHIIGVDILELFSDFYEGKLDLARFNYGVLALIPKCADAQTLQQYRPICLLNVIFKIFTKVLNNRAITVADKIVAPIQTTLIREGIY